MWTMCEMKVRKRNCLPIFTAISSLLHEVKVDKVKVKVVIF